MGKKSDLTNVDCTEITSMLGNGMSTLEIAKYMNHDHRTIKKFVFSHEMERKTPKRSLLRTLSSRDIRKLKIEMAKTPHATSRTIFDAVSEPKMGKTARCEALKILGKVLKLKKPPLSKHHKSKTLTWAQRYIKTDFNNVIFTDECRATLDGLDGWSSG